MEAAYQASLQEQIAVLGAKVQRLRGAQDEGLDAAKLAKRCDQRAKAAAEVLRHQELEEATQWVRVFWTSDLFAKPGATPGSRLHWHVRGHVSLLPPAAVADAVQLVENTHEAAAQLEVVRKHVIISEGEPAAPDELLPGAKVVPLQSLLLSCLCATGGVRYHGKAPRGGAA